MSERLSTCLRSEEGGGLIFLTLLPSSHILVSSISIDLELLKVRIRARGSAVRDLTVTNDDPRSQKGRPRSQDYCKLDSWALQTLDPHLLAAHAHEGHFRANLLPSLASKSHVSTLHCSVPHSCHSLKLDTDARAHYASHFTARQALAGVAHA